MQTRQIHSMRETTRFLEEIRFKTYNILEEESQPRTQQMLSPVKNLKSQ